MQRASRNAYSGARTKTPKIQSYAGLPRIQKTYNNPRPFQGSVDRYRLTQNSIAEQKAPKSTKSRVSTTLNNFHKIGKSKHLLLEYLNNLDESTEQSIERSSHRKESSESILRKSIPGLGKEKWKH